MKCVYLVLLVCFLGCMTAHADGYTSSQKQFLVGGTPVASFMDEVPFEQYIDRYWSSYIDNPMNTSALPVQAGGNTNSMSIWMAGFPAGISSSSFGVEEPSEEDAEPMINKYEIGLYKNQTYQAPFEVEGDSVQKNRQFLQDNIMNNFGQ